MRSPAQPKTPGSSDPGVSPLSGPPRQFGGHDESRFGVQTIKYADEPAWIRAKFEAELAKHNLKSDIPDDAYNIRDYEWDYGDDD